MPTPAQEPPPTEAASFGTWVRARRAALALTRPALAAQVGCSVVALRKVEDGSRHPSVALAMQLAPALDVPAAAHPAFIAWARGEIGSAARVLALLTAPEDEPILSTATPLPPLPINPTSFVGRHAELAAIRARLGSGATRLLTLTGPGGVGKTRLALQVAEAVRAAGEGSVVFVPLAALADPALVPAAIAHILGVPEVANQPMLTSLQVALRGRPVLLVIDNFEQLLAATPQVAQLLAACPEMRLLITSREPLHLPGEAILAVPPLAVPDLAHLPAVEQLSEVAAVALFTQRAQASRPDFALTAENASVVAAICARLDGLPLALELAAARVRLLPPAALLPRLARRLDLLADPVGRRPARHQTLRATIAWSYDLLDPPEQAVFRRLAVFAGGAALEAAEAVAGSDGPLDCLAGIESLVDKSLITFALGGAAAGPKADGSAAPVLPAGEPRCGLLETIREYALEQLQTSGEADATRRAHAGYFLALAEAAESQLEGAGRSLWLDRLEREHDNFRAALDWALAHDSALGLRLAAALWPFWWGRGHWSEGRTRLAQYLAAGPARTAARAKALQGAGTLAYYQGDYAQARPLHEEGLAIYREVGDPTGTAALLIDVASYPRDAGEQAAATALLQESLALYQAADNRLGMAHAFLALGFTPVVTGTFTETEPALSRSLALYRVLGSDRGIMWALNAQAEVARHDRKYVLARELYAECVELCRILGDQHYLIVVLHNFAHCLLADGQPDPARTLFLEALPIAVEQHASVFGAWCLAGLGAAHAHKQEFHRAARLFGAADVLLTTAGISLDPMDAAVVEWYTRLAQGRISPAAWEAAWAAGRAWTLDRAFQYARQTEPAAAGSSGQVAPAGDTASDTAWIPRRSVEPLTRREREVLRLIAAGLSNDQVAARLCISINTVETHTRAIYGKLDVTSRSAATRAALEHKLV
ncbi:MAG TPA: tetratricopeptide repeat protein [Chloroflexia bacterium]|nr:tetratricopeptide repeat protein [Chloroflexia bacterium]